LIDHSLLSDSLHLHGNSRAFYLVLSEGTIGPSIRGTFSLLGIISMKMEHGKKWRKEEEETKSHRLRKTLFCISTSQLLFCLI